MEPSAPIVKAKENNMTTQTKKLLPCPFCGGEANVFQFDTDDAYVACSQCNGTNGVNYPSEEAAIAAWNTRTPNLSALDSDEAVGVVARAIAINSYHENGLETMCYAGQEDFANREQHHYLRDAKAAIQAVRGMLEAGRG